MRRPELTPARDRSGRADHAAPTRRRLIGGSRLREIVEDPEKRTWPLGNSLDVPHNREARNPILESVWERSPLAVPVARRLAESRSGEKS